MDRICLEHHRKDFEVKKTIELAILSAAIIVVLFSLTIITAKKKPTDYYPELHSTADRFGESSIVCIHSYVEWDVDEKVYCSNDIEKIIQVLGQLKQTLK